MIGSYDKAKICKMIGLFLLHHLFQLLGKNNLDLNRDDSLAIIDNASDPSLKHTGKKVNCAVARS